MALYYLDIVLALLYSLFLHYLCPVDLRFWDFDCIALGKQKIQKLLQRTVMYSCKAMMMPSEKREQGDHND